MFWCFEHGTRIYKKTHIHLFYDSIIFYVCNIIFTYVHQSSRETWPAWPTPISRRIPHPEGRLPRTTCRWIKPQKGDDLLYRPDPPKWYQGLIQAWHLEGGMGLVFPWWPGAAVISVWQFRGKNLQNWWFLMVYHHVPCEKKTLLRRTLVGDKPIQASRLAAFSLRCHQTWIPYKYLWNSINGGVWMGNSSINGGFSSKPYLIAGG